MANLLGVPDKTSYSPPNTFRAWQYALIVCVLAIGAIYALPNLYQPDPAIQIRSQEQVPFESDVRFKLREELVKNGVYPKSIEMADSQYELLVRFNNDQDQLRGQALVDQYLSENRLDYLASLNRASTAPAWLRDIGGKPMSLGLDLSGGVHFLLQVDMDQYLNGVVADAAEAMRDMLIKERIRFIPGRNWVEDGAIVIKFRDESDKDSALDALDEFCLLYTSPSPRDGLLSRLP